MCGCGRLIVFPDEAGQWVAHCFVAFGLTIVSVREWTKMIDNPFCEDEGAQGVWNGFSIELEIFLRECPRNSILEGGLARLVPIWQHDLFGAGNAL